MIIKMRKRKGKGKQKPLNISMLRGGVKIEKLLARLNARSSVKQHLMKSVSLLKCDREQFCCKAVQPLSYAVNLLFAGFGTAIEVV